MTRTPITTRRELEAELRAGTRSFENIDLPDGADLRDMDFSGVVLQHCWFADADFSGAILVGTTFRECNLKCASFVGADLSRASFPGSLVEAIVLTNARLDGVIFERASAYGYEFGNGERP